jgi:ribonuclease-3
MPGRRPGLPALERRLRVKFQDPELLVQALTHRSFANEHAADGVADNERLEFLGDAVLELITADVLYRRDPEAGEGSLTLDRSALASTGALATAARRIDLGKHLRVGKGVEKTGGRALDSLLANALEAVIGAVYLDLGMETAARVFNDLRGAPADGAVNHKGRLQELTQADSQGVPAYRVIAASGPGHDRRYRVEVRLAGVRLGKGQGSTRRAAEQAAAREAIATFEVTRTGLGNDP